MAIFSNHAIERLSQRTERACRGDLYDRTQAVADSLARPLNEARIFATNNFTKLLGLKRMDFLVGNRKFRATIGGDGLPCITTREKVGNRVAVIGIQGFGSEPVVITLTPPPATRQKPATPRWVKGKN